MYNWVTRRITPRTEGPTYPARAAQTVDSTVATWIPATVALLACFVTPVRADLDARYYESPTYPVRAVQTVDATVATWQPADTAELASFRTGARAVLDVRRYEWDVSESAWIQANLSIAPTVAQTLPAWTDETHGGRTSDAPDVDVRREWAPSFAWVNTTTQATIATWAPIFTAETQSYRTTERARLEVRSYEWKPAFSWVTPVTAATVAKWAAIFSPESHSGRTGDRARLNVRDLTATPELTVIAVVFVFNPIWASNANRTIGLEIEPQ